MTIKKSLLEKSLFTAKCVLVLSVCVSFCYTFAWIVQMLKQFSDSAGVAFTN